MTPQGRRINRSTPAEGWERRPDRAQSSLVDSSEARGEGAGFRRGRSAEVSRDGVD